jgi:hypothetical protein
LVDAADAHVAEWYLMADAVTMLLVLRLDDVLHGVAFVLGEVGANIDAAASDVELDLARDKAGNKTPCLMVGEAWNDAHA